MSANKKNDILLLNLSSGDSFIRVYGPTLGTTKFIIVSDTLRTDVIVKIIASEDKKGMGETITLLNTTPVKKAHLEKKRLSEVGLNKPFIIIDKMSKKYDPKFPILQITKKTANGIFGISTFPESVEAFASSNGNILVTCLD